MKSRLVVLFLAVFALSSVSAQVCGGADNTIFKYSAQVNAHAELYSGSQYGHGACYTSTLGTLPPVPLHPTCTSSNAIFWLSSASNAHVNDLQNAQYQIPVCYADLTCYFDGSLGDACSDRQYKPIARAYYLKNAHVANVSSTSYDYKICCRRKVPSIAEWRNAAGEKIVSAHAGADIVYATLTSANGNRSITIFEYDPIASDLVLNLNHGSATSPNWSYPWSPTVAQAKLSEQGDYGNFRFKVAGIESEDLELTFCQDGKLQIAHEQCDTGIVQEPRPNPKYGSFSTYCNATTCQFIPVTGGYCGDKIVQASNETCDLGTGVNGNLSAQSGGSFCSVDCQNETRQATALRWENLAGSEITYAGRGDTVRLAYKSSTKGSDFNIYEVTKKAKLRDVSGGAANSDFVGSWLIPKNLQLSKWKKLVFKNDEYGTDRWSNILTIIDEADRPIKLKISGVSCAEVITKGAAKVISVDAHDPDDLISGTITIDGVEVDRFSRVTSRLYSKSYTFAKAGTVKIEVEAENTRGEKASAVSNVLVNDPAGGAATYTAACISKPDSFRYISGDYVEFDASTSSAIRQPNATKLPLSALTFDWKFSDGMSNPYKSGADPRSYHFNKSFSATLGYNWAELTVRA